MWNSSVTGPPVLPALIRAPTSVLRAVMTPSNGAYTFSNDMQLLQPGLVEARGLQHRFARMEIADCLVGRLFGDGIGLQQLLPARGGDLGELVVGLGRGAVGARLLELVVDLRRLDLREQLTGFHARADIGVPALEIAVGPRVDRRVHERLHVAGQHELLRLAPAWSDHRNGGNAEIDRLLVEVRAGLLARHHFQQPDMPNTRAASASATARRRQEPRTCAGSGRARARTGS